MASLMGIANPRPSISSLAYLARGNADYIAVHVQQRAAGVTRIDGRIRLQHIDRACHRC